MRIRGGLFFHPSRKLGGSKSSVHEGLRMNAGSNDPEEVAIKFIGNPTERNKREVRCLHKSGRHKHIIKYFDSGFTNYQGSEAIYIVMEKCDERTLNEVASSLGFEESRIIIGAITKGLKYIHKNRIIHRDLKPHNILFKGNITVISDFGLSKEIQEGMSDTHQSNPNTGTLGWRAKETHDEDERISPKADVFSAGLVFYFILTRGKQAFDGGVKATAKIIKGLPPDLSGLKEIPDCQVAHDLIASMLNHEPKKRPTMEEVLQHPFFWDDKTKLDFYVDVRKYMEFIHGPVNKKSKEFQHWLNACNCQNACNYKASCTGSASTSDNEDTVTLEWEEFCATNWKNELDLNEKEEIALKERCDRDEKIKKDVMKNQANKYEDLISEILRFIRNRYAHDHEDKKKLDFDMTIEEFYNFFSTRFPLLFMNIYSKMRSHFKEDPTKETLAVAKYFKWITKSKTALE